VDIRGWPIGNDVVCKTKSLFTDVYLPVTSFCVDIGGTTTLSHSFSACSVLFLGHDKELRMVSAARLHQEKSHKKTTHG